MGSSSSRVADAPTSALAAQRWNEAQKSRHTRFTRRRVGNVWKSFVCGDDLNAGHGHVNVCLLSEKGGAEKSRGRFACKWVSRSAEPDIIRDLLIEASILKSLDHPNIVRLRESWEDSHNIFLVLQLLTGPSLIHDLQAQPGHKYTEIRAQQLFRSCVSAVAYIHSHGIYHGRWPQQ